MKKSSTFKSLALAGMLTFSLTSQAEGFGSADSIDPGPLVDQFRSLDTNSNELLTPAEAGKDELFTRQNFKAADKDNDGTLDQQEYSEYKSADQRKKAKRVINDSVITSKVKASILKDEGIKGLQIEVKTHKGIVQLSGFVDTKEQASRAAEIASSIEGVKKVHNSLIVKG